MVAPNWIVDGNEFIRGSLHFTCYNTGQFSFSLVIGLGLRV